MPFPRQARSLRPGLLTACLLTIIICTGWFRAGPGLRNLRAAEPFSIVVLPDTQCYCDTRLKQSAHKWNTGDLRRYFFMQTEWARDNKERLNISFLVLSDDQCMQDGGESWLRYMVFQPDHNKIQVFTYNPTLDQFREVPSSRFGLDSPMTPPPGEPRTASPYRRGADRAAIRR